ncbi:MAG: EamA family transporter [Candidatus Harrisonbacteria bacterium]|nr:EamA family transporter [Candidatus Harrisonbacteria bacterium]
MSWFSLALIPPALYAAVNHLDKYLVSRYFANAGAGSLLIFSSLIGAVLFPFVYLFHPDVLAVPPLAALIMIGNGILYIIALLPYLAAIQREETSVATPLFQTVPVFGYVLGYIFLGETLTAPQLSGSVIIILGALIISLNLAPGQYGMKRRVLGFMLLSSFLIAVMGVVFKFVAVQESFWAATFWSYVGLALTAFFTLAAIPSARREFLGAIRAHGARFIAQNAAGEIINVCAMLLSTYATLLAPVALVWAVNGFQPVFTLTFGILLTLFIPRWGVERIAPRDLTQKTFAIALMILGAYFIQR